MQVKYHSTPPLGERTSIDQQIEGKPRNFVFVSGQVTEVPDVVAAKLIGDFPAAFEAVADMPRVNRLLPVDVDALRCPGASVSVGCIVTTFNGLGMTTRLAQSIKPIEGVDIRLVVVDNNSSDGTPGWCHANRVPYLQPVGRCSVPAALNMGLDYYRDDPPGYVFVLNNDVELPADYLSTLIAAAEADSKLGWVVGIARPQWRHDMKAVDIDGEMITGDASATLMPWRVLEKVGPWDEAFGPRYGEDEDMLTRVEAAGYTAIRLPVPYDGHMGGYLIAVPGAEGQATCHERSTRIYIDKYGVAPKSAAQYVEAYPDTLSDVACIGRNDGEPIALPYRRGQKTAAIIQNGRLGDIMLSFAMATELKRMGFKRVVWYAVPPWDAIVKLCPDVDAVVNATKLGKEQACPWELASKPAREHAEAAKHDRILLAQIASEQQDEYLASGLAYIPFMYRVNGLQPESLRPKLTPPPDSIKGELPKKARGRKHKPVYLNLATHSGPVRINWQWWDRFVEALEGVTLIYCDQPHMPWRGDTKPAMLQPFKDVRCVPYMAQHAALMMSVTSAPLWSAFACDTPGICLLPRNATGLFPEGWVLRRNAMARNGVTREWEAMDVVLDGKGRAEQLEPEDLAEIVSRKVSKPLHYDLRGVAAGLYTELGV